MRAWNDPVALKYIAEKLHRPDFDTTDPYAAIRAIHTAIDINSKCLRCYEPLADRTHSTLGHCLYAPTQYHSEALDILWEAYQRCDITYIHLRRWDTSAVGTVCAGTALP